MSQAFSFRRFVTVLAVVGVACGTLVLRAQQPAAGAGQRGAQQPAAGPGQGGGPPPVAARPGPTAAEKYKNSPKMTHGLRKIAFTALSALPPSSAGITSGCDNPVLSTICATDDRQMLANSSRNTLMVTLFAPS